MCLFAPLVPYFNEINNNFVSEYDEFMRTLDIYSDNWNAMINRQKDYLKLIVAKYLLPEMLHLPSTLKRDRILWYVC